MPLDPSIYQAQITPRFNNPFEALQERRIQQQNAEVRQQQINTGRAIEAEHLQKTAAEQTRLAGIDALNKIGQDSMVQDPTSGIWTFDRQKFQEGAIQGGHLDQLPTLAQHLDAMDAVTAKRATESRTLTARGLLAIKDAGYSPQSALGTAAYLHKNGLLSAANAGALVDAITADPSPANVEALTTKIAQTIPEYRDLLQAEETRKATAAKTAAETGKLGAETAKLTAEAAQVGQPAAITPYQQATLAQGAQRIAIDKSRADREARTAAQQSATFGAGAGSTGVSATLPPGTRNDDYLKQLPTPTADKVKALVEGRLQLPTRFTKGDTYWQGLLDAAVQYDPSFDAVNYNSRAKTRQDFTSGKSGQTVNALNTVAQHLKKLSESADKLNNTWSPTYNSVANFVSRHSGSPIVTNFETDKKAVVDELTRTWRQAGGTESDIRSWSAVLDAANSPDQIHGALAEMSDLIEGKLSASENQYQQGMGTNTVSVITPDARAALDKLKGRSSGTTTSDAAAKAAALLKKYGGG